MKNPNQQAITKLREEIAALKGKRDRAEATRWRLADVIHNSNTAIYSRQCEIERLGGKVRRW